MKFRILTLLLALLMLFSFASCTQDPGPDAGTGSAEGTGEGQTPTATDVRVYTLNGTTGFGMAKLMDDAAKGAFSTENYTFDVKTDASEVLTALVSGDVRAASGVVTVARPDSTSPALRQWFSGQQMRSPGAYSRTPSPQRSSTPRSSAGGTSRNRGCPQSRLRSFSDSSISPPNLSHLVQL